MIANIIDHSTAAAAFTNTLRDNRPHHNLQLYVTFPYMTTTNARYSI